MSTHRRIAVVTGTRAEYGLLGTVLDAIEGHEDLESRLIVTGTHLLPESNTVVEIRDERSIDAEVSMQHPGSSGRFDDARALGRGILGIVDALEEIRPDVVLVLGDRIEAFAAASAAGVAGIHLAHMHGGDRAMGVADEAMRHAITKLAHLHLPATPQSADRIQRMGESSDTIVMVGSPAVDRIRDIKAMDDREFGALGNPSTVFLMHGVGDSLDAERHRASEVLAGCAAKGAVLALAPNPDPGSTGIRDAIKQASPGVHDCEHLPRERFLSVLHRVDALVGNSSAGLIEAAVIGCPAINIGIRQEGRERASNVMNLGETSSFDVQCAIERARMMTRSIDHPYGDGRCGERVAETLASISLVSPPRKCNSY